MTWQAIWNAIHAFLAGMSNKDHWKMSIDKQKNVPMTQVRFDANGALFAFQVNGVGPTITLEAVPGNVNHATVHVNGQIQDRARLVFELKHQLLKPVILVFEFRRVTVGGSEHTYRFDYPR